MSDLDDAVRKQLERMHAALASGMPRLGWKICVNERTSQQRLGLREPFVGFLNGSRCLESGATCSLRGGAIACEPEIAIRVAHALDGDASPDSARAAIGALAPALEIVDYSLAAPELGSIVESSSFHFGLVLGPTHPGQRAPRIGPGCPTLLLNEKSVGVPDPELVPEDLGEVVRFVAHFLARFGERLEAGDWILSGACTKPARVRRGDTVRASFDCLGDVSVRFDGHDRER